MHFELEVTHRQPWEDGTPKPLYGLDANLFVVTDDGTRVGLSHCQNISVALDMDGMAKVTMTALLSRVTVKEAGGRPVGRGEE